MKFRKKPIVIDATQFRRMDTSKPDGLCWCAETGQFDGPAHVHTLEGAMTVSEGDWIITGVKGERYPCKPDIFVATYDPA